MLVFERAANGTLGPSRSFSTGGLGSGAGLGSQGALTLSRDQKSLYAVNAGSNEISAFSVAGTGLSLVSNVGSGGVDPISVTVAGDLVYALNAGDAEHAGNIAGFRVNANGGSCPYATRSGD